MSPVAFLYRINSDGMAGEHWPITEQPLVVGRGDTADAPVNDPSLSRGHFMLVREANAFVLVDLDSQNGTWVADKKIRGCKLSSGQIIRAGQSLFYFSEQELEAGLPKLELPVCRSAAPVSVAAQGR